MQILLNEIPHDMPDGSTLAQALEASGFQPPFAVAVNLQFVPKTQYANTALRDGDRVEVISPITGG